MLSANSPQQINILTAEELLQQYDAGQRNFTGVRIKQEPASNNLAPVELCEASLLGADFSKANLSDANFAGVDLRGVNFQDADLSRVNLAYADLCGANLRNANLTYARLTGARLCGAVMPDGRMFRRAARF